jgi:hypothetical protein
VWTGLEEQEEWAKVVYYGDPGTGKTTALAGLARLGLILFVNVESGLKKTPLRLLGVPTDDQHIQVTRITSWAEAEALVWDLRERFAQNPQALLGVCIDSITEIEALFLNEISAEQVRKAARRGIARDEFLVEGDDWQRNSSQMRQWIRELRDLPCHVGFSALSRRDMDEEGLVVYRPALTPKAGGALIATVDISVAMQPVLVRREGSTFWGITRRQKKYMGKDRFGIMPARFPNPSFDRIVQYLRGEIEIKTDPEVHALRQIQKET